ncbi:MAG: hypothetical protein VXX85_06630 [Candidatus Margulisiibacteriota bacterium]|nr:hypothetical protein [Candidatus Margulisiibacteriota bacterium]
MIFNKEQLALLTRFLRLELNHLWVVAVRSIPSILIWTGILVWLLK